MEWGHIQNQSGMTTQILLNGFAEDHSLNNGFTPDAKQAERNALVSLEICLKHIRWMDVTWLS